MQTITLKPLYHNQQECIGIFFSNLPSLNKVVKNIPGCRFTKTFKCWYVPLSEASYNAIASAFKTLCKIDDALLRSYLTERKKTTTPVAVPLPQKPAAVSINQPSVPLKTTRVKQPFNTKQTVAVQAVNMHVTAAMRQQLILKAYSPSTIKTYLNEMGQLLQTIGNTGADSLTPEHLKRYLVYCFNTLKLTENTLHSRINALKFYYEQVLGRQKFFWEIPRPKKPSLLPKLLNETALKNLFNALKNKKHKAMLFTAYSAGLRVSEIVNLKIADIDSVRMQVFIQRAKGKKDRYVNLSPVLLDILRNYIRTYSPKPNLYLFESEQSKTSYPTRTVQQIFTNAKNNAGIKKEVGVHSLRHSFATHLLDKGTDIKFIKDLLGHFDIKTTERYLHVSKQQLVNIVSPLDDLMQKETIEW
jgi:integrase/recombinase XerD